MEGLNFINKELAMENCMNDEEFFKEMLCSFVDDSKLEDLKAAFSEKDYDTFGLLAHAVKSQSRIIGASALQQESYAMEQASDNKDYAYIKANIDAYIACYERILGKIKEVVSHT